jgi:hypothetical protein
LISCCVDSDNQHKVAKDIGDFPNNKDIVGTMIAAGESIDNWASLKDGNRVAVSVKSMAAFHEMAQMHCGEYNKGVADNNEGDKTAAGVDNGSLFGFSD